MTEDLQADGPTIATSQAPLMQKPALRINQPLPLGSLSPNQFEDFTYIALEEVGPLHGFQVTSHSSGTADGGFDVNALRIGDGAAVCVQCKRLAETFYVATMAPELAKVALQSALEGSRTAEHYFVTTGKVSDKVRSALREADRETLVSAATAAALRAEDLKDLRAEAARRQWDLPGVVNAYVLAAKIFVWSGREFDLQIGRVWSRMADTIGRFFAVDVVLREHPRPDFDEAAYLARISAIAVGRTVPLWVTERSLPPNLRVASASDPLAHHDRPRRQPARQEATEGTKNAVDRLVETARGTMTVLIGEGGAGKTVTMTSLAQELASRRRAEQDDRLPVFLSLRNYRGDLRQQVETELRIRHGHWESLPDDVFLICDGLNELPTGDAQSLLSEVRELMLRRKVSVVVSVRPSGMRRATLLPEVDAVLGLGSLSTPQIVRLSAAALTLDQHKEFMALLSPRLYRPGAKLFALPFGLAAALDVFLGTGRLPDDDRSLIDDVIRRRFARNQEVSSDSSAHLLDLPFETVRRLAESVAFEMRVVRRLGAADSGELHQIIKTALASIEDEALFGPDELTPAHALALLRHYEFLTIDGAGWARFGHDLLADRLASVPLQSHWSAHLTTLRHAFCDDAWVFAGPGVHLDNQGDFLNDIAAIDLFLAAHCAVEIGPDGTDTVEPLALARSQETDLFSIGYSAAILRVLGTTRCVDELRRQRLTNPEGSERHGHATRALVRLGDEQVLDALHARADAMADIASGGDIDLWQSGPPDVRLRLARRRVGTETNCNAVTLSLRTIYRYGGLADVPLVEGMMDRASDRHTFFNAFICLHELSPGRAVEKLRAVQERLGPLQQVDCLEALANVGAAVDHDLLASVILGDFAREGDLSPKNPADEYFEAMETAVKILRAHAPPALVFDRFRGALADMDDQRRHSIWQIVAVHAPACFDDAAEEATGGPLDYIGHAALFVTNSAWSLARKQAFTEKAKAHLRHDAGLWFTWGGARLIDLMLHVEEVGLATQVVCDQLSSLLDCYAGIRRNASDANEGDPPSCLAKREDSLRVQAYLGQLLKHLVRVSRTGVSGRLAELLRIDVSMRLSASDADNLRQILRPLGDDALDSELVAIADPYHQASALAVLSALGATPLRVATLRRLLPGIARPGSNSHELTESVKNMWGDDIARMVVEVIPSLDWRDERSEVFLRDLVYFVANHMTRSMADRIVRPALAVGMSRSSRETLRFWYEAGMHRRGRDDA